MATDYAALLKQALAENPDLAEANANNPDVLALAGKQARTHKYNASPTEVDGIRFASKREAQEYSALRLLEKAGDISQLQLQPRFTLLAPVTGVQRAIEYVADFSYIDRQGRHVVVEVKGYRTPEYKLKVKLFRAQYPELVFMEVR